MVNPAALLRVLLASATLVASAIPAGTPAPTALPAARTHGSTPRGAEKDAQAGLPLLPARPEKPRPEPARRWEYITVVTLLSAPFTALWYGLAVGAVESVVQRRFPPKFTGSMYAGLGAAAGATSLSIALFSVSWGGPRPGAAADVSATATKASHG